MEAALKITEFNDPACPFGWSAEPSRRRIDWLYGDQIEWELRLVGLSDSPEHYYAKDFTPEKLSASFAKLGAEYGMPMDARERPRMFGTLEACKAIVAARVREPGSERAMMRHLRLEHFRGERMLDEAETTTISARASGIDPDQLWRWMEEDDVVAAFDEDMRLARDPSPAARAQYERLASEDEDWRLTCPSWEIERVSDGASLSVPGFQPLRAYEVAIANLAPGAEKREAPADVSEVLAWADEPLASAEVAAVCEIDIAEARQRLGRAADQEPLGQDGLWTRTGLGR
ncbi:hypothetical protein HJD18_10715 [Thermoleophilia bacterium SCSIO 60948]|nr:hypothetical protein HJD18_10715 [Thermoleophilia bacterium SCSIO 60948]